MRAWREYGHPVLPRPRIPRRVVAIAAAGGLAVAALGLTGCEYPAGPGSVADTTYVGCGDTSSMVRGCTSVVLSVKVGIKDKQGDLHPLETGDVITRSLDGSAMSPVARQNVSDSDVWFASLEWPSGRAAAARSAPIRQRLVSAPSGLFQDRWVIDSTVPTRAAANLPAAPVASLFSHDSPAARGPGPLKPTILDARQSTGSFITVSWDTNGDGTFGDDPRGGWTGVPALAGGTAYLPQAALSAASVSPSVHVTDGSGQTTTAKITVPTWDQGAGGLVVGASGDQISLTPDIGTLPTGNVTLGNVHYACIDIGDDGTYDTELPQNFVSVNPAYAPTGFYPYLAPSWSGIKRVRVAFFQDDPTPLVDRAPCNSPAPLAQVLSTHVELVNGSTRAAMERGAHATAKVKRYVGTARVRLAGGAVLSPGTQTGTSVTGVVNRGRYTLRTPARGGGMPRPAAIAAFASGDFASSSNASFGVSDAGLTSLVGTTTMVIRGTDKALACIKVAQTGSSTIWTVMGGTGAARTLRMVMNGGATLNSLITSAVPVNAEVSGKGTAATKALSPVSTSYKINASSGAGRGMSSACRALVKRLP